VTVNSNIHCIDYGNHAPPEPREQEDSGANDDNTQRSWGDNSSIAFDTGLLTEREWKAIRIQQSLAFWQEPKDLLITLVRP
jgi:hypothetical protein